MMETKQLDGREQRAIMIAAVCKIDRRDGAWLVPSQSAADRKYQVRLDGDGSCTCLDCQEGGFVCKHIRAVKIVLKRELGMDGSIVETRQLLFEEKKTYRQDWPRYDRAQMTEKNRFQELLHDLCRMVPPAPQAKTGRRRTEMGDMVFASVFKVFTGFSSRRFACDLADAHEKGFLSHLMHSVSTCAYLEADFMTPVLKDLVVKSSLPLRAVETVFAPDSTGFSVSRHVKWFDEKYGAERSGRDWVKAHAICGVKTNVVCAVEILDRHANDCPQFKPLVEKTAENFTVREVAADKAYLSRENLDVVAAAGGTAFIPMKSNSIPGERDSLWERMYYFYQFKKEEFGKHYHQRSNAESTFSMLKAKFGDAVRSKTDTAMRNEVYCKFIAHNISVVHQSQVELGIEANFWTEDNRPLLKIARLPG